jgi:hypothetical protein
MATAANRSEVLEGLARDGIVTLDGGHPQTTRRWQSAMMRAIARNMRTGGDEVDVRYVIADALLEIYGRDVSESALADAVEAMTLVELELLRSPTAAQQAGR